VKYKTDSLFHLQIPTSCPGVPDEILDPKNTWKDKQAFQERAKKLANDFSEHFEKAYGNKGIEEAVKKQCPGK
jgi:phosphoenolpyruvate carboxykinase (ATP)